MAVSKPRLSVTKFRDKYFSYSQSPIYLSQSISL